MRAPIGVLFLSSVLLAACASTGDRRPTVHPKARKAEATKPAFAAPPVSVATPTPMPPPPPGPPPPIASPSPPVVPPLPSVVPSAQPDTRSEIPTRAPRRDKPDWVAPATRPPTATPVPVPVRVPPPPPAPTPAPPAPISPPPAASTTPVRLGPITIDRATGQVEARLPCNRAASPHCDLRIYQAYVGTFVDGSDAHNSRAGYGPGPHTGDIEGVIASLDHIKAMGFNAIWLTPIFDSKAGEPHIRPNGRQQVNERLDGTGYFTRDYFKIDPQFGTQQQVEILVDQAHVLGIKVFFDGVFGHHKGNVTPSPTGKLPVDATDAAAYDGAPQNYPGRIVDYSDPRSTAFYKEVARYWIDILGIDGWRLDQVYQVPSAPLREITAEITRASNAQLLSGYVVGEMWGTADQIRAQLGPSNNPALASAFDFPTRYALVQTLATDENGGTNKPASTINESWALGAHLTYPDHAIMNFMLGNHDLVRFGDLIERAGKGGPDSTTYWALHKLAFTFMAAWSGPITLYYGEEVGAEVPDFAAKVTGNCAALDRCDDHAGRNMVAIPGLNTRANATPTPADDLKAYLTKLMTLRSETPALSSGARTHVFSDTSLYIDLKSNATDRYLLVMNTDTLTRDMTIRRAALGMARVSGASVSVGDATASVLGADLKLSVPALSAAIVKLEGR